MAIAVYGAYWAFRIGAAFPVKVYRRQAFGIGMVSLAIVAIFILLGPVGYVFAQVPSVVYLFPMLWISSVFLLYWIDSSTRAGRRSDPLLRDTLRWSKLRQVVWAVELAMVGVGSTLYAFAIAGSVAFNTLSSTPAGQVVGFLVVFGPILITGTFGSALLPLVGARSRDMLMRAHLKWFAAFFVAFLLSLVGAILVDTFLHLDGAYALSPGSVLFTYCLYRGAKSLAPLNRIDWQAPRLAGPSQVTVPANIDPPTGSVLTMVQG